MKFCVAQTFWVEPHQDVVLGEEKKRNIEVWATINIIKDKMTGWCHILWCIFEKIAKELKLKIQDPKTQLLNVVRTRKNVFPFMWLYSSLFCQTSPRWCSQDSPGRWINFLQNL